MDRSEYMSVDADYWYNKGMEDERAKIVTWLKMVKDEYSDSYVAELPDRVEAGEHLK